MESQTVLRRSIHHPISYIVVAVIAFFVAGGIGPAIGAFVATWFLTGLIP